MSKFSEQIESRRSYSRVTDVAPTHDELLELIAAAGRVADHSALHPWRFIEIRGDSRARLGLALAEAGNFHGKDAIKQVEKAQRAPLLLAIVAAHTRSEKVPEWEQDAVAAGVAHLLSALLHEAGWGVIWRTGHLTRSPEVSNMHELATNEVLLGWLYVGGIPDADRHARREKINASAYLTAL